jgi:hypothetical protein
MNLPADLTSFVLRRVAARCGTKACGSGGWMTVQTMGLPVQAYQDLDGVDFISRAQINAWAAEQRKR